MSDRPPIVPFLLAFIGLIAVALGVAMLSSMPEPAAVSSNSSPNAVQPHPPKGNPP